MSEKVGCFFETENVELGEAATNFDDQFCAPCPHFSTCLKISSGQDGGHLKNDEFLK